jgi:hypothetical protein
LIPNLLGGIAQLFFSQSHVSVFRNPSPAPVLQYITSAQFCSVLFCSVHHFCSVLFISTSFLLSSVRSVQFCLVLFSHSVDTFSGYKPFTDAALQQSGSRQESEICNSFRNSVDTKPPRWHCSQLFFSQSHVSVFRNPSPAPVLQYITLAQFCLVQYIMFSDQTIDCHKKSENKPLGFHFLVVSSLVLSFHFLKTSHSVDTFSGYIF